MRRPRPVVLLVLLVALLGTACGDDAKEADADAATTEPVTLRLGMFPNVTHAPGLVGVEAGLFADALADNVTLEQKFFNAGPEAVEALFGDALDITYIGPNPAINAFAQSNGEAIRVIAGATSGGAFLVVQPEIDDVEDLAGTTLATPQLGNTQDVALRAWLEEEGFEADTSGGGEVSIKPQANADTLTAFKDGSIDGAWVPEPWATRLVQEGGGKVLIDEADLWDDGRFVTTHVVVRTAFLEEHPDVVKQFLEGHLAAVAFTHDSGDEARTLTNDAIEKATQKRLPDVVIDAAWENLEFTFDPLASSLAASKDAAVAVGLLDEVDLDGIYHLSILNELLAAAGEDEVEGL